MLDQKGQLKILRVPKEKSPFPRSPRLSSKSFFYIHKTPKAPPREEAGSALILAIMFLLVATVLITTGLKLITYASKDVRQRELTVTEAENVAKAGLVDALSWFRRQSGAAGDGVVRAFDTSTYQQSSGLTPTPIINPLTGVTFAYIDDAFNPQNSSNLQFSDTLDASIGIVNEMPLDSAVTTAAKLWGRYEVKRQGSGAYDADAAHDVTGQRSSRGYISGNGLIWNVVSKGFVYRRFDYQTNPDGTWKYAYNQVTNNGIMAGKVLAQAKFSTEFRKLALNMPSTNFNSISGGIYVNATTQVYLKNNQSIISGSAVSTTGTYPLISMGK